MLCHGSACGRLPGGRRGRGSGRERAWAAAPRFSSRSVRPGIGATLYRAHLRAGAGGRSAPARFARLIARARGKRQDALRLSAESGSFRTGPARAGRSSGCLFPPHHSTLSENASPMREILLNFHEQFAVVSRRTGFACLRPAALERLPSIRHSGRRVSGDPGPASTLAAASAVQLPLRRLRRHCEPWMDPGSGAGATKRAWGTAPGRAISRPAGITDLRR